ncbi:MAG: hydroxypyruvate isomerase [Acidobacteria bacterium]|jgi:hydroxypyruvate isomerase|nr:hydroxypyruvate isomerase [Acidobacteriota bacterium]MDP7692216.1 TIM barrel protein [Vicinamibacterales bacterium]HJN45683.1 TIM barrel protein [Vicinamibacterales bacterium]
MPKLAANFSMMFGEVDMLERFELAARVGFQGAEIQDPYGQSCAEIASAYRDNGLEAVLFNLLPAVGAVPGRERDFETGCTRALDYAEAAGCAQIHCMAGSTDDPGAEATFVANLRRASAEARPLGVRLLLEPLNTQDNPGCFLTGSAQARRIIDLVGEDNVFLQYDLYHMQIMEGCLAETIKANLDIISHIQVAGVPGRHEPGAMQEINYPFLFDVLDESGYDRWVGCEYRPLGDTLAGLNWARKYGIDAGTGR